MGTFNQIKMGMDDYGISVTRVNTIVFHYIQTKKHPTAGFFNRLVEPLLAQDLYLSFPAVRKTKAFSGYSRPDGDFF
jgi:hypothetical protein